MNGAAFLSRIRAVATLIVGGCLFYSGLAKAVSPGETLSSLAWAFEPTPVFLLLIITGFVLGSAFLRHPDARTTKHMVGEIA